MKKILANTVYSDSTLKSLTKEQLIELIRILEHNWASAEYTLNIQSKNCELLIKQAVKDTAKEILTELLHTSFEKMVTVSNYKKSKEDIEIVAKVILTSINEKIKEIAKRKGVEVE